MQTVVLMEWGRPIKILTDVESGDVLLVSLAAFGNDPLAINCLDIVLQDDNKSEDEIRDESHHFNHYICYCYLTTPSSSDIYYWKRAEVFLYIRIARL